jgi:hypothetical protein
MENLKKIESSWREMDKFSALATKLHTTTNLTQKKLKEDMVSSFVKKMASQVCKHNKRYLLTKHLVRAVFAECQTGQVVAQFLLGTLARKECLLYLLRSSLKCTIKRLIVRSSCYS